MEEQVLVVRTEAVKPLLNGMFSSQRNDEVLSYILSNYMFLKRDLAEHDPDTSRVAMECLGGSVLHRVISFPQADLAAGTRLKRGDARFHGETSSRHRDDPA